MRRSVKGSAIIFILALLLWGGVFLHRSTRVYMQSAGVTFVGAGDIASGATNPEKTAKLLDEVVAQDPNAIVWTTGDNAYPDGKMSEFNQYYHPTWGRHRARTRPTAGNHDHHVSGAQDYLNYFCPTAADCVFPGGTQQLYYSYDVGGWHIIALDSDIDISASSQQVAWLKADLAANPSACILAYWHHPRYTSHSRGSDSDLIPIWNELLSARADVVLNGHNHMYERFAPQDAQGQADPMGIRQFVVGSGGASLYSFSTPAPNSEVRYNGDFGVLKFNLRPDGYDWNFMPVAGSTFTDSGSGSCANGDPAEVTPTVTPTPTIPGTGTVTRQIAAGADDVEERESSGSVSAGSSDLEFTMDGSNKQAIGMRFTNVSIPQGAVVTDAYIQLSADEQQQDITDLTFYAHAADNAAPFTTATANVSARPKTFSSVSWNTIPVWTVNQWYTTPNLAAIVQEVVNRPGWNSGNAMAFVVAGTGHRTADSYEGGAAVAPRLTVTYTTDPNAPTPTPMPSATPTPIPTATPIPTDTPVPTATSIPTATPTPGAQETYMFTPVADTYVLATSANSNYGTRTTLLVDGSPVTVTYMRFDLSAIAGRTVTSATLRLRITDSSSAVQNLKEVTSVTWSETGTTYNNRPALGSTFATFNGGSSGTFVNVPLTSYVSTRAGQQVSIGMDSTGSNGLDFYSRERTTVGERPTLTVTVN